MKKKSRNRGLTLVELIILLSIVGLIIASSLIGIKYFKENHNNSIVYSQESVYFQKFSKAALIYASGLGSGQNKTITVSDLQQSGLLPESFPDSLPSGGNLVAIYATDPSNAQLMDLVITASEGTPNTNVDINETDYTIVQKTMYELSNNINSWLSVANSGPVYSGILQKINNNNLVNVFYKNTVAINTPSLTNYKGNLFYSPTFINNDNIPSSQAQPFIFITAPNDYGYELVSFNEYPGASYGGGNSNFLGDWASIYAIPSPNQLWYRYIGGGFWYPSTFSVSSLGFSTQCPPSPVGNIINPSGSDSTYNNNMYSNTTISPKDYIYCIRSYKSQVVNFNAGPPYTYVYNQQVGPSSWGNDANINNWNTILPTFNQPKTNFEINFSSFLPLVGSTMTEEENGESGNYMPSIWDTQYNQCYGGSDCVNPTWFYNFSNNGNNNFISPSNPFNGLLAQGVIPSANSTQPNVSMFSGPLSMYETSGANRGFVQQLVNRGFLVHVYNGYPGFYPDDAAENCEQNNDCYAYTLPPPPEWMEGGAYYLTINGNTYIFSGLSYNIFTGSNSSNVNGVPLGNASTVAESNGASFSVQGVTGTTPPDSISLGFSYYQNGDQSDVAQTSVSVNPLSMPLE